MPTNLKRPTMLAVLGATVVLVACTPSRSPGEGNAPATSPATSVAPPGEMSPAGDWLLQQRQTTAIHLVSLTLPTEQDVTFGLTPIFVGPWSPDGSFFAAFATTPVAGGSFTHIFLVPMTANGPSAIVDFRVPDSLTKSPMASASSARIAWSPDSRHVAVAVTTETLLILDTSGRLVRESKLTLAAHEGIDQVLWSSSGLGVEVWSNGDPAHITQSLRLVPLNP